MDLFEEFLVFICISSLVTQCNCKIGATGVKGTWMEFWQRVFLQFANTAKKIFNFDFNFVTKLDISFQFQ